LGCGLVLALGLGSAASAAPVTFRFAGTVASLTSGPNTGIAVGMAVDGHYTFEGTTPPATTCRGPRSVTCTYPDAVTSFAVSVPAASLSIAQDPLPAGSSMITAKGSRCLASSSGFPCTKPPFVYTVRVASTAGGFSLSLTDNPPAPSSSALPLVPPSYDSSSLSVNLPDGSVFAVSLASITAGVSPTDYDGDGVPDTSDNCTYDVNPLQENTDGDLLGDVCDPFPKEPDNEKAQCFVDLGDSNALLFQSEQDLAQARADLGACQAQRIFADSDRDGEEDATDQCGGTPAGLPVDTGGCSLAQFCAARVATCKRNDWMNDEPGVKKPLDCVCN
jgi:hypothetical protein